MYVLSHYMHINTLFFQSALCRQSAVETKSQNQGQSGTRQGQIGTRVGQIGTGEGQIGTGEGQLEISYRVLETWFSSINEVSKNTLDTFFKYLRKHIFIKSFRNQKDLIYSSNI